MTWARIGSSAFLALTPAFVLALCLAAEAQSPQASNSPSDVTAPPEIRRRLESCIKELEAYNTSLQETLEERLDRMRRELGRNRPLLCETFTGGRWACVPCWKE